MVELVQILKDDALKVPHSIFQQFGKLSNGHRTGKLEFSTLGLGRSPGEGKGYPLQYYGLENSSMGSQRVGHD